MAKAVDDFNAALNVDDHNSDAWAGLGLGYEKLRQCAKAAEAYQRAAAIDPGNAEARQGCAAPSLGMTTLGALQRRCSSPTRPSAVRS